jgi:hypothetical protein
VDSGQLTREELVALLSERTLVLHALHRETELVADFIWLAALEPEHILDMRAPPDLVGVWTSVRDQARGPLGVRLIHETTGSQLRLRAELTGTVPEDAQTRLGVRPLGGSWEVAAGQEQLSAHHSATEFEAYGEVLGPGGLVVAREGSPEAPVRITLTPAPKAATNQDGDDREVAARRKRRAWLIGGSAALVVAAAVTSFFLVQSKQDKEQPVKLTPMVTF